MQGQEPKAREPDVILSMPAVGSLANGKILPDIPSNSMASRAMLSIFPTTHDLLKQ